MSQKIVGERTREAITLQECVEGMLGNRGTSANPNQREMLAMVESIERVFGLKCSKEKLGVVLAIGAKQDREMREAYPNDENFIIDGLPKNITLYSPIDLIQATKDFYSNQGFRYTGKRSDDKLYGGNPNYDEQLFFERNRTKKSILFDLSGGYSPGIEGYELWVGTHSFDF